MRTINNRHTFNPCGFLQAATQVSQFTFNAAVFIAGIYYLVKNTENRIPAAIALSLGPLPNMLFNCRSTNNLLPMQYVAIFNTAVLHLGVLMATIMATSSQDENEQELPTSSLPGVLLMLSTIINLLLLVPTYFADSCRSEISDHRDTQPQQPQPQPRLVGR